ncbi:MAG: hypothetical protein EOP46_09545 [Sphingobacteriaceae bacterium]|nr:MAG: hypothetical protein EOP46_09545 [Sphingobacteriaceae bacterium]
MNKQDLKDGTVLIYTGKPFDGFDTEAPQATFLGYDSKGWENIWIDYKGVPRYVLLSDVEVVE